jgi:hypothetical protein
VFLEVYKNRSRINVVWKLVGGPVERKDTKKCKKSGYLQNPGILIPSGWI